jgi:hypothetical protein
MTHKESREKIMIETKANCSTDLDTDLTPDGKRRCDECGVIWSDDKTRATNVRCTNAAVREIKVENEDGYFWMWTCGQRGEWVL